MSSVSYSLQDRFAVISWEQTLPLVLTGHTLNQVALSLGNTAAFNKQNV